ncbi:hypothetical protein A3J90_04860 [candidate division WOR-1 bacterium RIFOXYC2_FULL_37_10]|uniref:FAD:protein FMN transferase n=1 Tax=candidate division WOR-1 bacterium RIFOXYB2_FULL_37_13 TaxID=1802579 RepID=A0A1F4SVI8_UNCSA|nr:MAG: hypothetical protein A2246_05015 [candidate division WOR-1 bacterium RIFOXYA2_FULL_37_7]OGC24455.1 MAG: hypothetical protein A2310_08630 [candidate division WOR-1 bacterium RIFOXYB2_FULL_37_13]OGC35552.1 MAG: hypothetical protein A3J90_04860 [candidate division WOR-1 bacterium RIFOXYC2_FULL_37_10]
MGTFVTIKIKGVNAPKNITLAYNRIKELEKIFNRFDPASEISKINSKLAENTKTKKFSPLIIKLSKDAYNCIALAQNISKLTNGAFDITLTGNYKNMTLNPEDYSIKILKPKIQLNLDGIAKGFAVEEARFLLFKRNVKDGIIDMRSSIAVFDIPKKIGVKNPFEKSGIFETISLNSGQALSTSGTYEQGLHIINPVDKKKVDYWVSITVIGKDAGFLDGLSTGLFVMKKDEAVKLVKSLNLGAILITKDKKVFKVNI